MLYFELTELSLMTLKRGTNFLPETVKLERNNTSLLSTNCSNNFMNDWINTSMKRRAARHTSTAKPKTGPRCPHCSRHCASISDYAAILVPTHLLDGTILSSATSSSIPTDFSSDYSQDQTLSTDFQRQSCSAINYVSTFWQAITPFP